LVVSVVLVSCSVARPRASEEDLVEVYVLAVRARERGQDEAEVQRVVEEWLREEELSREDLRQLVRRLDGTPGGWARVWSRIDERLRSRPQE
jgi:hypothetical protein